MKCKKSNILVKSLLASGVGTLLFFLFLISTIILLLSSSNKGGGFQNATLKGVPEEFIQYFNEAAEVFKVPNWTLAAIAKQESNFNPNDAYGGAWGIMQIQKTDWSYYIGNGLGDIYKELGYSYSSADDMWNTYLNDVRAQILAGSWECMRYTNVVLKNKGIISKVPYKDNKKLAENMGLIDWYADENDSQFREILRRSFACYNGGPGYGLSVNLDTAQNDYPNKVFGYAMEFRNTGLVGDIIGGDVDVSDSEKVNAIISLMQQQLGKPYLWGATGPNRFDCSGLMLYCFKNAVGINLPRTANSQYKASQPISFEELQPGDFVFRLSDGVAKHVQLYIGNGKVIHAPQKNDVVKISDVPHKSSNRYGRWSGLD
ncbi:MULTISPECIES: NlpC/P60 family protein [unclassified Clostridioides]|uniref:C40 family peptidase n=2 Tax=Clostridioides TaxID=1870884 RepID=UPI001D12983C|nr:C40 family peptidase [Clostridioides sp. ZZV14-6048]MCC0740002.1 C40 family peptidase [Clostridioides sp. ZZV14-5902]